MPKAAAAALVWSSQSQTYEIRETAESSALSPVSLTSEADQNWLSWLAAHSSFSFQGREGHLTLQKETRARGDSYWYAYRYQAGRTAKKYLGRTANLTFSRLEAVAAGFARPIVDAPVVSVPENSALSAQTVLASLLVPKLRIPRPHPNLIFRPFLLAQLERCLSSKLTLLSAPAGFGKTSLLSAWLTERADFLPPVGWIALDSGDNDPGRFWAYFIAACQNLQPDLGLAALPLIRAQQPHFKPLPAEAGLTSLLNELAQLPEQGGILVLEDYHLIINPEIHQGLNYLLEHLPANLHLIILSRNEPPLLLARLRARGELLELGVSQLRFSAEETQIFLQQVFPGASFAPETLERLQNRTEGWATGLRLLTLALQNQPQHAQLEERLLALLSGSQRHILEYLISDVLSGQPEFLQIFLLQTTGLPRLSGSLCQAVTDRSDSAALLEQVERLNLFLLPLDSAGDWYRYHSLFAESIQHEARRRLGEQTLREIARRASHWYEQHAMLSDAIEVVMSAGEFSYAAPLINRQVESPNLSYIGDFHTLLRWLKQMPFEVLQEYPLLCQIYAILLLFNADYPSKALQQEIERYLEIATNGWQVTNNTTRMGELLALKALYTGQVGTFEAALSYAKQALPLLTPDEKTWRSTCLTYLGIENIVAGNIGAAYQIVQEARVLMEATGNVYGLRPILCLLGNIYFEQGKLEQAATLYRQVLETAEGDLYDRAFALAGLASLDYEANDLKSAEQYIQEVLNLNQAPYYDSLELSVTLLLVQMRAAQADFTTAEELLVHLLAKLTHSNWQRELETWLAWLPLAAGDLPTAQERFEKLRNSRPASADWTEAQQEREALLQARLLLQQGQTGEALELLNEWRPKAHDSRRARSEASMLILQAVAYFKMRKLPEARQFLSEFLAIGQVCGYQRLFLAEDCIELQTLLNSVLPGLREKTLLAYAKNLLRQLTNPTPPTTASPEPLSPQEKRVLRLLLAGHSNPQIAAELVVSVNTVKAQVKSIYRKLDVTGRVEASQRARQLNLV